MKTSPRQALTDAAEHLRAELGDTPANVLLAWRDQYHPLTTGPARHSWEWLPYGQRCNQAARLIERVCRRCGLVDEFRPMSEGGRSVRVWRHVDGCLEQQSKTTTPPCRPLTNTTTTTKENS
jgi:hypothetical protein